MPRYSVEQVGIAAEVFPSFEELRAINYIKTNAWTCLPPTNLPDGLMYQNAAWKGIVSAWNSLKYLGKSVSLLNTFNSIGSVMKSGIDSQTFESAYSQMLTIWGGRFDQPDEMFITLRDTAAESEAQPAKLTVLGMDRDGIYKGNHYASEVAFTDEQFRLLILDCYDQKLQTAEDEKRFWDGLHQKYDNPQDQGNEHLRHRISESVRTEVWRRDGGKCARCGSRQDLEFDHVVPISRGGSNTARNVELLCERCNRAKSNHIA